MIEMECAECNKSILTGERRDASRDGPIHHACELRREAVEKYSLFIVNPEDKRQVSYSLWFDYGEFEIPMLSNSSGLNVFNSINENVGNAIPISEDFVSAVAYGYHDSAAQMGYMMENVDRVIDSMYDKVPAQDRWAIHNLVSRMWYHGFATDEPIHPEFGPLVEFTNECTEFGVPEVAEPDIK